jgi:hypothetical protein
MCLSLLSMPANAQATRTWVSGVGDDANPCSRTAPCKTFAGAISKTAVGGEINCLDPGGFGALTITSPMAIICDTSGEAGVLVAGTNGINVSLSAGGEVVLSGLDFEGLNQTTSPGVNGISFTGAGSLYVRKCIIHDFSNNGISFTPGSGFSTLVVQDTVVDNNSAVGIFISPSGGGDATAYISYTQLVHNAAGLMVQDNGHATVFQSSAVNNNQNGFLASSTSATAEINLTNSVSAANGNGIATSGAHANIRIAYDSIFDNTMGINTGGGGTVQTFSPATSTNAGNGTQGGPNGSAIGLQ